MAAGGARIAEGITGDGAGHGHPLPRHGVGAVPEGGLQVLKGQLGGPDGELGASMRYLNQRYAMPYKECKGILTDIGTEELAHMEMISAIVYQLTRNLTPEQIKEGGFDAYFVDHTTGIYPQSASGVPWSAATFQSKGDPITDLFEDMAAEATPLQEQSFRLFAPF